MKVCFIYNREKVGAYEVFKKCEEYLKNKKIEIVEKIKDSDLVVVIGGDGTLLGVSREIALSRKKVIAINMGTLGFLTEIRENEAFSMFDKVLKDEYKVEKRRLIEVEVGDEKCYALNEVVLSRGGIIAKLVRVSIFSNETYINTYRADGIIISTPTGSTAYSLSAGGPIVKPGLDIFIITPIAPQNLSTRAIVIGGDEELTVRIEDTERVGYLTMDGQRKIEITMGEIAKIKYSKYSLNLIVPEKRDYYSVLREKLKWGDNIC